MSMLDNVRLLNDGELSSGSRWNAALSARCEVCDSYKFRIGDMNPFILAQCLDCGKEVQIYKDETNEEF